MKPADVFWVSVPVVAIAHNVWAARTGREQLSQAMDRYRAASPVAELAVMATAAHLCRRLPAFLDPWAWLYGMTTKVSHSGRGALGIVLLAALGGLGASVWLARQLEDTSIDLGPREAVPTD